MIDVGKKLPDVTLEHPHCTRIVLRYLQCECLETIDRAMSALV